MKREDKFKDTPTFHYYNANPKNRITGDCAFRAISTALEQDYNQTVMEMAEMMCKTGFAMNDAKGEEKYLASKAHIASQFGVIYSTKIHAETCVY